MKAVENVFHVCSLHATNSYFKPQMFFFSCLLELHSCNSMLLGIRNQIFKIFLEKTQIRAQLKSDANILKKKKYRKRRLEWARSLVEVPSFFFPFIRLGLVYCK